MYLLSTGYGLEAPPGCTETLVRLQKQEPTVSWRRRSAQGCGGGEHPRVGSRRKDVPGEPAGYTDAEATPGLSLRQSPRPGLTARSIPSTARLLFRSHHITMNSLLYSQTRFCSTHRNRPPRVPACVCILRRHHHRPPQRQRTKATRCTPHQDSRCSVGVEVLSTDSVQNPVTRPLRKSREVKASCPSFPAV